MFGAQLSALLDIASGALPDVDRTFIAGGPIFAKNCHSIVVSPEVPDIATPAAAGSNLPGLGCVQIPKLSARVTYVKDCYPVARDDGGTITRPKPADVTTWTIDYVDRFGRLVNALIDNSGHDTFGGECGGITIRAGGYQGPLGGVCWASVVVDLLDGTVPG